MSQFMLSSSFRKCSTQARYVQLQKARENPAHIAAFKEVSDFIAPNAQVQNLADTMTECAIGAMPIPLGIVNNLCVDDVLFHVPIATEEPSVSAAASFAAKLLGSIRTECDEPLQDAHIALHGVSAEGEARFSAKLIEITNKLMSFLKNMHKRGGGLRGVYHYRTEDALFVVLIRVDVRDALGANVVNTAAEYIASFVAQCTGGTLLSAIVSNYSDMRFVRARCIVNTQTISKFRGKEIARNIERMCSWAKDDVRRAVTHNKGIMNGVSSFALATGNDTRAIEAAAHAHASSGGVYRPLSSFEYDENKDTLHGKVEIPALFATVGGGTSHPVAQWVRTVLAINYPKRMTAHVLNRIAASLALAQNFAALRALVNEGIQKGHMKFHIKREALS